MTSRSIRLGLIALMGVLVLILGLSAAVLLLEDRNPVTPVAAVTPEAPATTAAAAPSEPTALPPPVLEELPTLTPTATPVPTETSTPTATPEPTNTPEPTATTAPIPTAVIRPTAVPPTPVPPTAVPPTAAPPTTNGLTALHFAVQPRSVLQVNQPVWFEFSIGNSAGGPVPFGALGVMPKKGGADRPDWYQHSWGGNNDAIPANGLQWEDNIRLPETGAYTLRLVICFGDYNACRSGGPWVTLSQEIPITIN